MGQALAADPAVIARRPGDATEKAANDLEHIDLAVEGMHCGTCISTVEDALIGISGVTAARANLTARRVSATFEPQTTTTDALIKALAAVGYRAAEVLDARVGTDEARLDDLLRRLGVAGFAAANVMLLSVSVWAGLASDMEASAQELFHWLSALIALPSIAYSAVPFYRSAATALRARRLNMDVPISLGITLATGMSVYQTTRGSDQVYFDAAIMLTFFLLIGRYLDEAVRVKARSAAENLLGFKALSAHVMMADGTVRTLKAREIVPGMKILVAAGEHIPVDGIILSGTSDIEESLITGETLPVVKSERATVYAGTLNTSAPLVVEATAADDRTLVAEIGRLMQTAEQGRGLYVRLADRAARKYAPAVHLLGLTTLVGWLAAGADWQQALTYAIAVLIITCPCALALAVPTVQVAAATRLFQRGLILKSADGLERLSETDTVIFDKTGTLTLGEPRLLDAASVSNEALALAASIATQSRHPYSRAITRAAAERRLIFTAANNVREIAGSGLEADTADGLVRLGSASFTGTTAPTNSESATIWLRRGNAEPIRFDFEDELRADAADVVEALRAHGYRVEVLSGDRPDLVAKTAAAVGIDHHEGAVRPEGKLAHIEALKAQGRRVLMVGDGLNDAPALAAGNASISPSTASDISQTAADAVFQGKGLAPVIEALQVATAAHRMSIENFAIALAYNVVSVPLAMAGYVTPLIAALAMSLSSIAVVLNAIRLRSMRLRLAVKGNTRP